MQMQTGEVFSWIYCVNASYCWLSSTKMITEKQIALVPHPIDTQITRVCFNITLNTSKHQFINTGFQLHVLRWAVVCTWPISIGFRHWVLLSKLHMCKLLPNSTENYLQFRTFHITARVNKWTDAKPTFIIDNFSPCTNPYNSYKIISVNGKTCNRLTLDNFLMCELQ